MKTLQFIIGFLLLAGIETATAQYRDLHDFNLTDGADPYGSLMISGSTLYGITPDGGANWASNDGNVFSLDTNGSAFTDLLDFNGANGRNPYSTLVISGSTLYGTTWMGETGGNGNIFSIATNGNNFTSVHNFTYSELNGGNPRGSIILSDGVFYGTCESGGVYDWGCIFSMNMDGSNYTDLFDFNDTDGATPKCELVLSGSTLYGLTSAGGANDDGVIFSINTNGTGFTNLLSFNGENGANPQSSLIISGNTLYGMTYGGAANNYGNIFSIKTDGSGFTDMFDFNGTNGKNPTGDLTLSGTTLYGMTLGGGTGNNGIIFSINTNGTGFTDMFNFNYTNGSTPRGSLTLCGNMLYGMTSAGGVNGCGVVFGYRLSNPINIGINTTVNVACNGGNTGNITATEATGGVSPYTYSWSPNGGNSLTASNLSAGSYTITVTDNLGNTATASTIITQPSQLISTLASITDATCDGSTGSASVIATGGTAPYTYLWTNGGTNATETGLYAGSYTAIVTDNNGCNGTVSVTISEPVALTITIDSVSNANECSGMASISVSGGTAPYTYLWSPNGETTSTIKNQCKGTYCCMITDAKGCSKSTCIDINTTTTGTEDISSTATPVNVYPNPTSGPLTVSGVEKGMTIEIYDNLGRKLSAVEVDNEKAQLDLSNQSNGIYLIRFISKDGALASEKKVIKTK